MPRILITVILVAALTYVYSRLVRRIDRFEKEPTSYLIGAFLWGAVPAIVLAILVELVLGVPLSLLFGEKSLAGELGSTAVIAPVVEEILKAGAVAIIYLRRRREFDGWVDGIVYGSTAGFGFAFVENILYLAGTGSVQEWITLFFLRVVVFGMMHGFWTSLTGIGFGVARYASSPNRRVLVVWAGLSAAMLSHMVHNGALVLIASSGGSTLAIALLNYAIMACLLIGLGVVAGRSERNMMRTYLLDEVPGVLSPNAYALLCSTSKNALAALQLAPKQQRMLIQTAAELAQKKRQLSRMGEESGNSADIQRLRTQLAGMGR